MYGAIGNWRCAVLSGAAMALTPVLAGVCAAQTAPKDPEPNATTETQLKDEDDLYILKDVPEPEEGKPKLDLGKVGKKGQLSLEKMPLDSDAEYDTRPRGAGGIRLKIPLGKQAP